MANCRGPNCSCVIVLGAGIIGSATAYQLVKNRIENVLLLEQFERLHSRGSSCGQSRITRMAYKKPFYIPMMSDAFRLWSDLERDSGVTLYKQTGYLEFGPSTTKELNDTIANLRVSGVSHEVFSGQEANRRYPNQLKLPHTYKCIYQEEGGILFAQRALTVFQQQFQKLGGTLLDNHKVTEFIPGEVVTVVTNRGTFKTKNLVIAAGPWAPAICSSIGVQLPLEVKRIEVLYWKVEDTTSFSSDIFPTTFGFVEEVGFYGMPVEEYPDMVKISVGMGVPADPDNRDVVTRPVSVSKVAKYITSTFRGISSQPSIIEYCMYTAIPDYDPVIDRHPYHENIVIAAGFTGHGFKLSPVFGKMLAELVMREDPSHNLHPFRAARFLTPKCHI